MLHIKLAEWGGLRYYLLEDENPSQQAVIVKDENGYEGVFLLNSGSQIGGNLSGKSSIKASEMIRNFRNEFLEYCTSFKN